MIHETGIIREIFIIVANLMTDVAMTGTLADMGTEGSCAEGACGSLVLVSRLAKQAYRRMEDDVVGMAWRHLVSLAYVRDHDACPQQDLADAFCMDANNVVLLLNELEQLGFVSRLRDQSDRRRHVVALTAAGREALLRAERIERALEEEILRALEPAERETLRQLLARALAGAEPEDAQAGAAAAA
jgi:DNA-binding MarR family transcriptional regulator